MKKIMSVCIALLLGVSMIGCTDKQEETKEVTISDSEVSQEVNVSVEEEKNNIEKYKKLIGLSKEEIIKAMGEEPNSVDEGGLEFSNASIRVWFGEDGKKVNQIFINNNDVDFNGAKVGEKIECFTNVFGKPVGEDTGSAYSNFDYEGLVLHVQYDPSTEKVFSVYLMEEWK
ncbi:hypothetical protein [Anaeromicrobium sediminis]|uniref:DUF4309 domain-containing protein n=1 Tax=Anaeromicrobium sediminis TaxID=1478221 RepID=A0A267MJ54_9FIRM|nr:hypothetical protein [Anaeromicrobium sediminis]PAB59621.1 hypothetical protein CCE28_08610 [Anaeromicrobium sediminis]